MRRSKRQLFRDKGSALNEGRRKRVSVPVDPHEGPHLGNDRLASSLLMSDHVKDVSEVSGSSRELEYPLPDKEISDEGLQDCLDDWVVTLTREDRMLLSLVVFQAFRSQLQCGVVKAAEMTSSMTKVNERTIRGWRKDFIENGGKFSCFERDKSMHDSIVTCVAFMLLFVGKYKRKSVIYDENCRHEASRWARQNSMTKGQPNITVSDFCRLVNCEMLPDMSLPAGFPRKIGLETARKFSLDLGFGRVDVGKKGLYIDGHERDDVVEERTLFLEKLHDLEEQHLPPPAPEDSLHDDPEVYSIGNVLATKPSCNMPR